MGWDISVVDFTVVVLHTSNRITNMRSKRSTALNEKLAKHEQLFT